MSNKELCTIEIEIEVFMLCTKVYINFVAAVLLSRIFIYSAVTLK